MDGENNAVLKIAKPSGTGAHVFVPREWIGKVVLIVPKEILDAEDLISYDDSKYPKEVKQ